MNSGNFISWANSRATKEQHFVNFNFCQGCLSPIQVTELAFWYSPVHGPQSSSSRAGPGYQSTNLKSSRDLSTESAIEFKLLDYNGSCLQSQCWTHTRMVWIQLVPFTIISHQRLFLQFKHMSKKKQHNSYNHLFEIELLQVVHPKQWLASPSHVLFCWHNMKSTVGQLLGRRAFFSWIRVNLLQWIPTNSLLGVIILL